MIVVMIRWVTAFVDVPTSRFADALEFWTRVTSTTASPPRGDNGQFVTLHPADGDSHVRMQHHDAEARIHLDFHVDSVGAAAARAVELGAIEVADLGFRIMRSPGGFTFCFVDHHGEHDRGPRLTEPAEHRLDVVCIDAPADRFDAECRFWSGLTGHELSVSEGFEEFAGLPLRKDGLPWNLLVQRLGDDDHRGDVHAHLDVSAGSGFEAVADAHVALGAEVIGRFDDWVVLQDPAGLAYCVTGRRPD